MQEELLQENMQMKGFQMKKKETKMQEESIWESEWKNIFDKKLEINTTEGGMRIDRLNNLLLTEANNQQPISGG